VSKREKREREKVSGWEREEVSEVEWEGEGKSERERGRKLVKGKGEE
jgi:hypothetical protein